MSMLLFGIIPIIITGVLLLACLVFYLLYFSRNFNYWKSRNVPYIQPRFFFGNLLEILLGTEHPGKYVGKFYRQLEGPYFGFFAFHRPYLVLKDPALIKRVLIRDFHMFSNRYFPCDETIDPMMSGGLFASKEPYWRWLRTKLSPFFTLAKIKLMLPLISDCNGNLRSFIEGSQVKNVEAKEMAARYTTDVISTCAFGIKANSFLGADSGFRKAGRIMLSGSICRSVQVLSYYYAPLLVKLFKFKFIEASASSFMRKAFMETINQRELSGSKRNDLIDILVEMKNQEAKDEEFKLYGDRLVAQAVTFFSAGYETSASTIAFTLYELCVNTNIQNRLRQEIEETIKTHEDLTYEAVQDMKYLHMVVSETLRKYPPTSFIHRECSADYRIPETGLVIEKNTPVLVAQHGLHWDPKYFPNPERYDPERFNDENKRKLVPCSYLPFGEGPRNCIGEVFGLISSKMGIIEVVRNFWIERNANTSEPLVFTSFPILQAKGGVQVTLRKIETRN